MESGLKKLDNNLDNRENQIVYGSLKNDLESIYYHIADTTTIRSSCEWYKQGDKSNKYILHYKKLRSNKKRI